MCSIGATQNNPESLHLSKHPHIRLLAEGRWANMQQVWGEVLFRAIDKSITAKALLWQVVVTLA